MKDRYIFFYITVLTVIVAALLSLAALVLQPFQQANVNNEKMMNILQAADVNVEGANVQELFNNDCVKMMLVDSKGEVGEIYLAYTHFKNTVVHEPTLIKLLPVELDPEKLVQSEGAAAQMIYEPNEEDALDMIIPKNVTSLFYGALVEAVASENGARMQAMDSATSNAEDIISDLTLKYNRARQGAITQELTEIIAGASAIS